MSNNYVYPAVALIGGTTGALDSIDGAILKDGDIGMTVVLGDSIYFHVLDEDSGADESSPAIIAPDTNAGDKRWKQVSAANSVAFATYTEIIAGAETTKAVGPAQLQDAGIYPVEWASAAEITTGTTAHKSIDPLQLKTAGIGEIPFASSAEVLAGAVTTKCIAPDQLAASGITGHISAVTGAEHGATAANTANKIVRRDVNGDIAVRYVTGTLSGNCSGSSGSCTGNSATATYATSAGSASTASYASSAGSAPANGGNADTVDGLHFRESGGYIQIYAGGSWHNVYVVGYGYV